MDKIRRFFAPFCFRRKARPEKNTLSKEEMEALITRNLDSIERASKYCAATTSTPPLYDQELSLQLEGMPESAQRKIFQDLNQVMKDVNSELETSDLSLGALLDITTALRHCCLEIGISMAEVRDGKTESEKTKEATKGRDRVFAAVTASICLLVEKTKVGHLEAAAIMLAMFDMIPEDTGCILTDCYGVLLLGVLTTVAGSVALEMPVEDKALFSGDGGAQ